MSAWPGDPRRHSHDAWRQELTDMEEHLRAWRAAFASRSAAAPDPRVPRPLQELGPLPEELAAQAELLLIATRALEWEVSERRASLAVAVRHAGRPGRRAAAYVDASA
jgi:hypothetical protein